MLDPLHCMIASGLLDGVLPSQSQGRSMLGDYVAEILVVLVVLAALTLLLMGLIWISRKRKRRRKGPSEGAPVVRKEYVELDEDDESARRRRRVKVRYRRREHRPRNPTLAETGGLPPPRPDDDTASPPA